MSKMMFFVSVLFFVTGCFSLPKNEASYSVKYKFETTNEHKVFSEIKEKFKTSITKHNYSYEIKKESWINSDHPNKNADEIDIINIDEKNQIISSYSYLYVKYNLVPVKTYFRIIINVNNSEINMSFNEINTLEGYYANKIQLSFFKDQGSLLINDLLKDLLESKVVSLTNQ